MEESKSQKMSETFFRWAGGWTTHYYPIHGIGISCLVIYLYKKTNYPCKIGKCITHGSYAYTLVLVTSLDLAYLKINLWFPILYVSLFFCGFQISSFDKDRRPRAKSHLESHLDHRNFWQTKTSQMGWNQGETPVEAEIVVYISACLGISGETRARNRVSGASEGANLRVSISTSSQWPRVFFLGLPPCAGHIW